MRWAPRLSVLTDDGLQHSMPEEASNASDYLICSICNATMSKSAMGVPLMRLGCCFKIACATCFGGLWGIKPTAGAAAFCCVLQHLRCCRILPHCIAAHAIFLRKHRPHSGDPRRPKARARVPRLRPPPHTDRAVGTLCMCLSQVALHEVFPFAQLIRCRNAGVRYSSGQRSFL